MLSYKNNNRKLLIDEYKEVVVIGNGPSGICLSYFLSGNWPYWNKKRVSDEYLQMRLESIDANKSLIEQDLEFLSDGLMGRSANPVALLYDALKNPDSDFGMDLPSCLDWKYDATKYVDHVVIGKTNKPGGAWNTFAGNHLTVSLSRWMELPELSFEEINVQDVKVKKNNGRVSGNEVRDYYQNYVKKKHLEKNMLNNATVVSVRKMKSFSMQNPTLKNDEDHDLWEVYGTISCATSNRGKSEKYEFRFVCKYLVLATGTTDINNELRVPGEHLSYVLSSTRELEEKIKKNLTKVRKNPVLVVGSGLSAADCILIANKYRIKVVHVMRTSAYDTSNIVYTKLPKNDYPDYHWVYEKMLESKKEQNMQTNDSIDSAVTNNNYVLYDEHAVKMFTSSHTCVLHSLGPVGNETEIKISYACVLIGHSANLNFLPCQIRNSLAIKACKPASKDNPINVDPYTLETIDCKNLFGMGPIIGDGFVRYGTAGALSVTSSIWKSKTHTV